MERRTLELGQIGADVDDSGSPSQSSKLGGTAGLLQPGEGLEAQLAARHLNFGFQFSELDYPRAMAIGDYHFAEPPRHPPLQSATDGHAQGRRRELLARTRFA